MAGFTPLNYDTITHRGSSCPPQLARDCTALPSTLDREGIPGTISKAVVSPWQHDLFRPWPCDQLTICFFCPRISISTCCWVSRLSGPQSPAIRCWLLLYWDYAGNSGCSQLFYCMQFCLDFAWSCWMFAFTRQAPIVTFTIFTICILLPYLSRVSRSTR